MSELFRLMASSMMNLVVHQQEIVVQNVLRFSRYGGPYCMGPVAKSNSLVLRTDLPIFHVIITTSTRWKR